MLLLKHVYSCPLGVKATDCYGVQSRVEIKGVKSKQLEVESGFVVGGFVVEAFVCTHSHCIP